MAHLFESKVIISPRQARDRRREALKGRTPSIYAGDDAGAAGAVSRAQADRGENTGCWSERDRGYVQRAAGKPVVLLQLLLADGNLVLFSMASFSPDLGLRAKSKVQKQVQNKSERKERPFLSVFVWSQAALSKCRQTTANAKEGGVLKFVRQKLREDPDNKVLLFFSFFFFVPFLH